MNVLVIGNGGREHAILLALKKSKKVDKLYTAYYPKQLRYNTIILN